MPNANLSAAKQAKNDEFYTQVSDINLEMQAYIDYNPDVFRGKTVLLPCDDPEWSKFTQVFAEKFDEWGLKRLISTSYAPESKKYKYGYQPSLFEQSDTKFSPDKTLTHGKIFVLDQDRTGDGRINLDDLAWDYLEGDGDFRSAEVTALRDEADIIITNPPFSLFREFMAWIIEAGKQFSVIGNMNAITYKEIFPLIKENRIWLGGTGFVSDMVFGVPKGTIVKESDKLKAERLGYKGDYTRLGNSCWFTNLDHGRRHKPLDLKPMRYHIKYCKKTKFRELGYRKFDNFDAIEVPFSDIIPSDVEGAMGVPISYLDKYCPEQFEILGLTQLGCHDDIPDTRKYGDYKEMRSSTDKPTGSSGNKTNENAVFLGKGDKKTYYINEEGRMVYSEYKRLFIRKIKQP